jgi:hypothetical protein
MKDNRVCLGIKWVKSECESQMFGLQITKNYEQDFVEFLQKF